MASTDNLRLEGFVPICCTEPLWFKKPMSTCPECRTRYDTEDVIAMIAGQLRQVVPEIVSRVEMNEAINRAKTASQLIPPSTDYDERS